MSWTAVRLMFAPFRCGGLLTSSQKCALAAVLTHASQGDYSVEHMGPALALDLEPADVGVCVLSAARLAVEAGCAERTMRTRLAELVGQGLLVRVERGAGVAPAWVVQDGAVMDLAAASAQLRTPATATAPPGKTIRGPRQDDPETPARRSGVADDPPARGSGVRAREERTRRPRAILARMICPLALLPKPPLYPPPRLSRPPRRRARPRSRPRRTTT